MLKRFATFVTALLLIVTVSVMLPAAVAAQTTQGWQGVCIYNGPEGPVATIQGFQCLIGNVLQVALSLIGLAGFVMILFGAFKYMISGGNSKDMDAARNTVTFAIVGLVVAMSSFILINLISAFTGVSIIKNFSIPDPCKLWDGGDNSRIC